MQVAKVRDWANNLALLGNWLMLVATVVFVISYFLITCYISVYQCGCSVLIRFEVLAFTLPS